MVGALVEIGAGIVLVVYPEPVTTGVGLTMIARGFIRYLNDFNGSKG